MNPNGPLCQCFFFSRENEKCPRKFFLVLFVVFFSGGIFFLAHFFEIFSRAVSSFLGYNFVFFLGVTFFLLGQKFRVLFAFARADFCIFFSGKVFFSRVDFCCFFLGHNFASRAVFKIFFSATLKTSRAEY